MNPLFFIWMSVLYQSWQLINTTSVYTFSVLCYQLYSVSAALFPLICSHWIANHWSCKNLRVISVLVMPKLHALFEQGPTVMLPKPKSVLQSGLVCDRPTLWHFVYVVLMWPKLLAHLGQGPTDHVALHQLRPTDPVPGLVRWQAVDVLHASRLLRTFETFLIIFYFCAAITSLSSVLYLI